MITLLLKSIIITTVVIITIRSLFLRITYGPPADKRNPTAKSENLQDMHILKSTIHSEAFLKMSMIYHKI